MKRNATGKKGILSCSKCLLSRLEVIWLVSRLKMSKMSKSAFLAKSFRTESMGN